MPNTSISLFKKAIFDGNRQDIISNARTVDLEATSKNQKWTPLHFAAFFNKPDILVILLKRAAELEKLDSILIAKDVNGKTPLHLAQGKEADSVFECEYYDVISLLRNPKSAISGEWEDHLAARALTASASASYHAPLEGAARPVGLLGGASSGKADDVDDGRMGHPWGCGDDW